MLGAIAGDIVGSVYEGQPMKLTTFPLFGASSRFTDDTVMTVATAYCLLHGTGYSETYRRFGNEHPDRGYGPTFRKWLSNVNIGPRYSCGNGSAMRVSPIGYAFDSAGETLAEAKRSAEVSHMHPEAINGAQAVALALFMARNKASKAEIKEEIIGRFSYNLNRGLNDIRESYGARPDLTCQGSVPEAIVAFLESDGVESAIRNAVSLGGDADTQACIAGAIAEAAFGGVPKPILSEVVKRLPPQFTATVDEFYQRLVPGFIPWGGRQKS